MIVLAAASHGRGQTPAVRSERPRLFFRRKAWDGGLSLEELRAWMKRPEYRMYLPDLRRWHAPQNDALLWLLTNDEAALKRVLDGYDYERKGKTHHAAGMKEWAPPTGRVDSPSYTGIDLTAKAAVYDWLRDHPDFKDDRGNAVRTLEWWGDYYTRYLSPGVVPFYSRNAGALAGLTAVGLALHGDSEKAPGYVAHARRYLMENLGTIREMEDGATGGGTYGTMHQFTDLAHVAAMWRSATDWDAAIWIREHQGNWLERQMLWQIYATYPNGWFWKEGDIWSNNYRDRYEHCFQIDCISYLYNNGVGRTWSDRMRKRWGKNVVYSSYAWKFLLNNHPEIEPEPLSMLPRCEVFSPKLHGFVCWRDSWKDDAAIIHFKCGENVDHHGTWDTGKFTIWKNGPLAIKNGAYVKGYKSQIHLFYKIPWSANVVIFDHPVHCGWQRGMPDLDGYTSWTTWKSRRDKHVRHPVSGVLLEHKVADDYAYAASDLSGSTYPTGSTWTRELCFLGYKHLVVFDRVKPGKDVTTRWLLHSMEPATINPETKLVTIDNGKTVLHSRTLLPEQVTFKETGVVDGRAYGYPYREWRTKERKHRDFPKGWFRDGNRKGQRIGHGRVEVIPANPAAAQVYVHVLSPLDKGAPAPEASVERKGEAHAVRIGGLSHTFRPVRALNSSAGVR
jgi:hypothetical protein